MYQQCKKTRHYIITLLNNIIIPIHTYSDSSFSLKQKKMPTPDFSDVSIINYLAYFVSSTHYLSPYSWINQKQSYLDREEIYGCNTLYHIRKEYGERQDRYSGYHSISVELVRLQISHMLGLTMLNFWRNCSFVYLIDILMLPILNQDKGLLPTVIYTILPIIPKGITPSDKIIISSELSSLDNFLSCRTSK